MITYCNKTKDSVEVADELTAATYDVWFGQTFVNDDILQCTADINGIVF